MIRSVRACAFVAATVIAGCATQTGDETSFGGASGNGGGRASSGGNAGLGGRPSEGSGGASGTPNASGGASTGGTGGMNTGGTGGTNTGGASTGGANTGGASTGGVGTGGTNTGGMPATGGTNTGGMPATGGTSTGGMPATGGTNTGGTSTGGTSTGGTSTGGVGTGGTSTGGTGGTSPTSGMPVPPGPTVSKPAGQVGNLKVLNWAGFKSADSFSFDDALTSQIQHYSELHGTGVRMTFYLVSNNNGTSSTWTQAARDGNELGNHTAHHCHDNGTGCAWGTYAGSLSTEDDQCTTHITQTFGVSGVYTAAAPYGDAGYATTAQSKFFLNRSVAGGQVAPNDGTSPFSLPCHLAQPNETATGTNGFNSATDSAHSAGKWQIFLIHSLGGDGGYNPVSITEVVAAVNHAKSLNDVWADSVVNVGAYWRGQKTFMAVNPTTSNGVSTWTWTLPSHFPPGHFLRVTVTGGTLKQGTTTLTWDTHGYYEVSLDAGTLTLSP